MCNCCVFNTGALRGAAASASLANTHGFTDTPLPPPLCLLDLKVDLLFIFAGNKPFSEFLRLTYSFSFPGFPAFFSSNFRFEVSIFEHRYRQLQRLPAAASSTSRAPQNDFFVPSRGLQDMGRSGKIKNTRAIAKNSCFPMRANPPQ
jgi:hypothetical protein